VQSGGYRRGHGAIFSDSSSLAGRVLRINRTTLGRFAGMLSTVLVWLGCYQHLKLASACLYAVLPCCSTDVPQRSDSESLFPPSVFDEQGLEQISLGP